MRFGPDEKRVLDSIYDEAILANSSGGRVDHIAAAVQIMDTIEGLAAGGLAWAATYDDARRLDGYMKETKRRTKRKGVRIPTPMVGDVSMPLAYSRRRPDGTRQLALWTFVSLPVLEEMIRDLEKQSTTLTRRAITMRYGLELARRHGVATADEGFKAEGIEITDIAAA